MSQIATLHVFCSQIVIFQNFYPPISILHICLPIIIKPFHDMETQIFETHEIKMPTHMCGHLKSHTHQMKCVLKHEVY